MQTSNNADNNNNQQSEDNVCMWMIDSENGQLLSCGMQFDAAVDLFNHINNDHIGRRAGGNLCLQCFWLQPSGITTMNHVHNNHNSENQQQQKTELHLSPCGHSVEKRDHIVSHIRVHVVNYKPYECPICAKRFSRSQDCKKHEKTHNNSGRGANSGKPSVAGYQNPPHPPQSPSAEVQMHQTPVYIQRKRQSDFQLTQQQQQQQQPQYPERRDLGNVMQQFLGSIKRQRIQPRYDSEVRQTLNKIVEYQVANSAPDFNFMLVDGIPTIQEQNLQNDTNPESTDAVVPPHNIASLNQQEFHDQQHQQQQQIHSDEDLDVLDEIADEMDKDVLHKFLADLYQDLSIDQDVQSPLADDMHVEDNGQQQSLLDQQQPQLQSPQPLSISTVIQKLQENPGQSKDPDSPSFVTELDDELYADQQLRIFEQQTVNRQESLEVFMRDVDQAVQQSGVPVISKDTPDKKVKPLPRSSKGRYPRNSPLPFDQLTASSAAQQDAQQPRSKMVDVIKNTVEVSVSDPSAIIHKQVQFSPSRQQQQYSKKQQQQPHQKSVKSSISRNMSKLPADQTFSTAFKGAEFNPLKPQSSAIAILKSQLQKSATLGGNKKFGASKSLPAHASSSSSSSAGQQNVSSPSDNQQSIGNVDDGGPRTIELDFGVMKKVHLRIIEGLLVSLSSSNKK
ncbi:hypothetical protein MP228_006288 [Amoeboaphelidium protococcarum]|nr:hypothetical protein MP228_006288 [Amoeboaphelidium protococcarum]